MDLALFTSFDGRINRLYWWLGLIVLAVAEWIVTILAIMFLSGGMMWGVDPQDPAAMSRAMGGMMVPLLIVALIFLWPMLAVYAKRWHDRNKSGWWTLIILIPIVGPIWTLIELGFLRGTIGTNDYGPDPLAF